MKLSHSKGSAPIALAVIVGMAVGSVGYVVQTRAVMAARESTGALNQIEGFYSAEIAAWENNIAAPGSDPSSAKAGGKDSRDIAKKSRVATIWSNDVSASVCPNGKCEVPRDNFVPILERKVGVPVSLKEILASQPNLLGSTRLLNRRYAPDKVSYGGDTADSDCGYVRYEGAKQGSKVCMRSPAAAPTPTPTPEPPAAPCNGNFVLNQRADSMRELVNRLEASAVIPDSGAVQFTAESAQRICTLLGKPTVKYTDGRYQGNKYGYDSPSNNYLSRWDPASSSWIRRRADEAGNRWLASIRCECPITPDARRIFVSSFTHYANEGSRAFYSRACTTAANAAGLPGSYRAILSLTRDYPVASTEDDATNLDAREYVRIAGPLYNMNDERVADGEADFWSAAHLAPINYSERRVLLTGDRRVFTGTWHDGRYKDNCSPSYEAKNRSCNCRNYRVNDTHYSRIWYADYNSFSDRFWIAQNTVANTDYLGETICHREPFERMRFYCIEMK